MRQQDTKIKLSIPTIDFAILKKMKGGYGYYGGELDPAICIADGPEHISFDDEQPEIDFLSGDECSNELIDIDSSNEEQQEQERENDSSDVSSTDIVYSIEDAVKYLRENASDKSKGQCAKAVRLAIEAGGLSTDGRPGSACDYDSFLPTLGFYQVDAENYAPEIGDIVVHEAQEGHIHGHIAMYDGSVWISDFEQSDMFGGSAYRNNPDYTIWRR